MNDSTSILLATTILSLGGLGLFMLKSSNDTENEEYNEEKTFGEDHSLSLSSLFNWGSTNENSDEEDNLEDNLEEIASNNYKPRKKATKTLKNKKSTGSSRRRY